MMVSIARPCGSALLLLLGLTSLTAALSAPPYDINGLKCPDNVVELPDGTDLAANQTANTTYLLTGAAYNIRNEIDYQDSSAPLCCIGNGRAVTNVTVASFVTHGVIVYAPSGTVSLGLKGLLLQGTAGSFDTGVIVSGDTPGLAQLYGQDLQVSGFGNVGLAVFDNSQVQLKNCVLSDNASPDSGGGLYVTGSTSPAPQVVLDSVTFEGNSAIAFGGAIGVLGNCTVELKGQTSFHHNSAGGAGGAVYAQGDGNGNPSLVISGELCAFDNSAPRGAFADINSGASLQLPGEPGAANMDRSSPSSSDFWLTRGVVKCGASSPAWVDSGEYNTTGDMCACNVEFVSGAKTTCNTPPPPCTLGWDPAFCACKCTSGPCCDTTRTVLPEDAVCRQPQPPCVRYLCSGKSAACAFKKLAPNGQTCRYSPADEFSGFWPLSQAAGKSKPTTATTKADTPTTPQADEPVPQTDKFAAQAKPQQLQAPSKARHAAAATAQSKAGPSFYGSSGSPHHPAGEPDAYEPYYPQQPKHAYRDLPPEPWQQQHHTHGRRHHSSARPEPGAFEPYYGRDDDSEPQDAPYELYWKPSPGHAPYGAPAEPA